MIIIVIKYYAVPTFFAVLFLIIAITAIGVFFARALW